MNKTLFFLLILIPLFLHAQNAEPPANFVRIPGGTFTMGSPENEEDRKSNEIHRQVTISSFCMGKYEVTQKEYYEIMKKNPKKLKIEDLPVERVTWFNAVEYCNKLSLREGLSPAYTISGKGNKRAVAWNRDANGYRLPTEAEWEYTCRAGTATPFYTGTRILTNQANYNGRYSYDGYENRKGLFRRKTTQVGSFEANAWGLYDMHGNVSEWCWDFYGPYASGAQTDPSGAVFGYSRVQRGGGWYDYEWNLRSAYRDNYEPNFRFIGIGFRVVCP